MDKYEYRIEEVPFRFWFNFPTEKTIAWLNELGDEGWELVTRVKDVGMYIFKRNIGK